MITLKLLKELQEKLIANRQDFTIEERGTGDNGSLVISYKEQLRFKIDGGNETPFAPLAYKPKQKALAKLKRSLGEQKEKRFKAQKSEDRQPMKQWELGLLGTIKKEARAWFEKRTKQDASAGLLVSWGEWLEKNFEPNPAYSPEDERGTLGKIKNKPSVPETILDTFSQAYGQAWEKELKGCAYSKRLLNLFDLYLKNFCEGESFTQELKKKAQSLGLLAEDSSGVDFMKSFLFNYTPIDKKELISKAQNPKRKKKDIPWSWEEMLNQNTNIKAAVKAKPEIIMPKGNPRTWKPVSTGLSYEIAEIDLSSAYVVAAYEEGIISKETLDKLKKASKTCRLVALGALATKSQKTEYKLETRTYYEGFTFGFNGVFSAEEIEGQAKEQGLELDEYAKKLGLIKSQKTEYRQIVHPPTRPETSPIFFHVAQKVALIMEQISKEIGAYFFWVDAIFCHPSKIKAAQKLAKKLGFETKSYIHQSIRIDKGVFKVHKGGAEKESHYPITPFRIEERAAYFNLVKNLVKTQAQNISQEEFLLLANERLTGAEISAILKEAGITDLNEVMEVRAMLKEDTAFHALPPEFLKLVADSEKVFTVITANYIKNATENVELYLTAAFPKELEKKLKQKS